MRVLVTGSRKWADRIAVENELATTLLHADPAIIVHGDCLTGADAMADRWGRRAEGVTVERYPAHWNKYGGRAGPIRNQQMVDTKPDLVIAFGHGKGTDDCVRRAEKAGIPVRRIQ